MARTVPEWIGRTDNSMPGIHVLLRLYAGQNGICACPDECGLVMNLDRDEIDCDHKTPLRDGGENRESNLQLMFRSHHRAKTAGENVSRGQERQHKAKAFTAIRQRKQKIGGPTIPQRTATRALTKGVGLAYFQEPEHHD